MEETSDLVMVVVEQSIIEAIFKSEVELNGIRPRGRLKVE